MKWSPQQDQALKAVAEWLRDPDQQVFRMFGYAGTGKTTLAKHFAEGVGGLVFFCAFTGKAAYVLRQKGCDGATTIHSLIYHTKEKGRAMLKELEADLVQLLGELRAETVDLPEEERKAYIDCHQIVKNLRTKISSERDALARPMFTLNQGSEVKHAKLVVVDEASMVDDRMGEDLLSFGVKVLVLGDPAQLPPVGGAGFFTEGCEPDVMLTEIHRQARDNPIIQMATQVRLEKPLSVGDYGTSQVIELCHVNAGMAKAADQILVGKNKSRHMYNNRMRQILGITEQMPVPDDRLVCLRNNHDKGLLNGAIWYVDDVGQVGDDRVFMTVRPEDGGALLDVDAHAHYFLGNEDKLGWYERKDAEEFDYGYALTVHKAQGSQWDDVLLFDESYCFRKDKWKWLYTGITRAAERIIVVRT